jgi:hypothetical protein
MTLVDESLCHFGDDGGVGDGIEEGLEVGHLISVRMDKPAATRNWGAVFGRRSCYAFGLNSSISSGGERLPRASPGLYDVSKKRRRRWGLFGRSVAAGVNPGSLPVKGLSGVTAGAGGRQSP